jgi:hypothetical protein
VSIPLAMRATCALIWSGVEIANAAIVIAANETLFIPNSLPRIGTNLPIVVRTQAKKH